MAPFSEKIGNMSSMKDKATSHLQTPATSSQIMPVLDLNATVALSSRNMEAKPSIRNKITTPARDILGEPP